MSCRRRLAAVLLASLMVVALGVSHTASAQEPSPGDGLSKADREQLAIAIANGRSSVTLLIAAKGGAARQVVSGMWMKPMSKSRGSGPTCTVPSTSACGHRKTVWNANSGFHRPSRRVSG